MLSILNTSCFLRGPVWLPVWQGHLQELECEKGELGEQMEHLLEDIHRLLQHKTALGLEVTTYRYWIS